MRRRKNWFDRQLHNLDSLLWNAGVSQGRCADEEYACTLACHVNGEKLNREEMERELKDKDILKKEQSMWDFEEMKF